MAAVTLKQILLASVSVLTVLATQPVFAGAKTSLQWGADRTVSPWSLCAYDATNTCQPMFTLPSSGGGMSLLPGTAAVNGALPHVANLTALKVYPVTYSATVVRDGYGSPGDGGYAVYNYVASPCSLSAGAGDNGSQVTATNGNCWVADFSHTTVDPAVWGALGVSATVDYHDQLSAMFNYIQSAPMPSIGASYTVSGQGRTYATSAPLNLPRNIHFFDATLVALAGGSWCASDGSVTVPNPSGGTTTIGKSSCGVLNIGSSVYAIALDNLYIDVNRISNVTGMYCASSGNIQLSNVNIRHWVSGGNGFIGVAGCSAVQNNSDFQEWTFGDAEYPAGSNRQGIALGLFGAYDNIFHGGNFALSLVPMYLDVAAQTNTFFGAHPYQGPVSNAAYANPNGIIYDGFANTFIGTYLDSAPLLIRVSSGTNSHTPQIIFKDTQALYNASKSTFNGFVQFTTSVANTPLYSVDIDGHFPATAVSTPYTFAETGSGSWVDGANSTANLIGSSIGDTAVYGPVTSGNWFTPNLIGAGYSRQSGYLNIPFSSTATSYALNQANSGQFIYFNAGSTVAVTVPAAFAVGINICFISTNANATIQAATGGFINGLTTAITLLQNKPYCYQAFYNDGTNTYGSVMGSGL